MNMFIGDLKGNDTDVDKKAKGQPIKGENIETEISTTIEEAFYGTDKKISLRTNEGKIKTISVKIPEGILNGEKVRLIGQGKQGENGGKNGDLYLKINIENDSKFKLQGYDLYTDLYLTPWEAALGTRANVKTIDDETKVYIPQGTESGEKVRIPGKGYKKASGARGDLVAEIKTMFELGKIIDNNNYILTNARQTMLLQRASQSLNQAVDAMKLSVPTDLIVTDLYECWNNLKEILGEKAKEDLLDELFKRFCIGK